MLNYIARRLGIALIMLIGIVLSFTVINLPPGDFASRYRAIFDRPRYSGRGGR